MALVLPELFSKMSQSTRVKTSTLLDHYKHLIKWKNDASILEFGFGDGGNSQQCLRPLLPSNYKEFVATDSSDEMIQFAQKTVNMPRCEMTVLDIGGNHIPETFHDRFDHVFSFFTNHLVHNPRQMFKNVHTMLKSQGQTFQITFDHGPLDPVFNYFSTHPRWSMYKHEKNISGYYFRKNRKSAMEKDLIEAGFKTYVLYPEELIYEFPNEEEWRGLYFSVNPILPKIPLEELEEYKEEYLDEIKRHVLITDEDSQGNLVYKVKALYYVISAIKEK